MQLRLIVSFAALKMYYLEVFITPCRTRVGSALCALEDACTHPCEHIPINDACYDRGINVYLFLAKMVSEGRGSLTWAKSLGRKKNNMPFVLPDSRRASRPWDFFTR